MVGLAGVIELVGPAGVIEGVRLAGSPPVDWMCTDAVICDRGQNELRWQCRSMVSVNVYLLGSPALGEVLHYLNCVMPYLKATMICWLGQFSPYVD